MTLLVDIGNSRVKWARLGVDGPGEQSAAEYAGWSPADWRAALFAGAPVERVLAASVAGESAGAALDAAARLATDRPVRFVVPFIFDAAQTKYKWQSRVYALAMVGKLADFVVLSRDPTKGDPNTIDQIKVTETIKEGSTIFRLTPAEQRKADLMLKPDRDGNYAFSRALQAIAVYDQFEKLPAFMQQPAVLRRAVVRRAAQQREARQAVGVQRQCHAVRQDIQPVRVPVVGEHVREVGQRPGEHHGHPCGNVTCRWPTPASPSCTRSPPRASTATSR